MRILSLAAAACLLFAGSAHAATLDITLGNAANTFTYSSAGADLNPNINLQSPGSYSLVLNNNSQIVSPAHTEADLFQRPQGSLFGNNFLAVLGDGNPGLATFNLAPNNNSIGFTWGSVDLYNTLVITDSRSVPYVLTGADIIAHIGNPTPGEPGTQTDVRFIDSFGSIATVVFASSKNGFEAGNFSSAVSNVPLPPALVLFGLALASLFVLARRSRIRS